MKQLTLQDKLNMANKTVHDLMEQNALLTDDLQNANHDIDKLIKSLNDVTAENYALKSEIERTNRHINLAENQLQREQQLTVEQQPIIYNNCTFYNK
jgi:peptidoglycan hydrolase CwlO-like protein